MLHDNQFHGYSIIHLITAHINKHIGFFMVVCGYSASSEKQGTEQWYTVCYHFKMGKKSIDQNT